MIARWPRVRTPSGDPGMSAEPSWTSPTAAGLSSVRCSSCTSLWRTALLGIPIMAAVVEYEWLCGQCIEGEGGGHMNTGVDPTPVGRGGSKRRAM